MSERSMVTVLKTVVRKHRGFESLSLRQRPPGGPSNFVAPRPMDLPGDNFIRKTIRRSTQEAEGAPLLRE
jgi:hypothetical protein